MGEFHIIELVVRAEYQAWVNIIRSAELSIVYQVDQTTNNKDGKIASGLQYVPLESSRQVRLLLIYPGSFNDDLKCKLIHSGLDDIESPGFEAMSYCWGDPRAVEQINLEYKGTFSDFGISHAINDILRYLRYNNGQVRTLWIDAICIDQNNNLERAEQVGLMADIYSKAHLVNIWLGPPDDITRLTFRVIRNISNHDKNICAGGVECDCPGTRHMMTHKDFENIQSQNQSLHDQREAVTRFVLSKEPAEIQEKMSNIMYSHYPLFSDFYENPWFRRVWVLQEVMRSKKAILHCGLENIEWSELVEADSWRAPYIAHLKPLYRLPIIWETVEKTRKKRLLGSRHHDIEISSETPEDPGILNVFLEALELDATDPRDKIFALLSFGQETNSIGTLSEEIRPNYNKSVQQVFADFTRWWIREHKSLRILSMVHGNMNRTWLNIYCPTSAVLDTARPTWALGTEGMHIWSLATLGSKFQFRASGESVPGLEDSSAESNQNALQLHLSGYKVAKIEEISSFPLTGLTGDDAELFRVYLTIFEPALDYGKWKGLHRKDEKELSHVEMLQMISEHHAAHWEYEPTAPLSLLSLNPVRKEGEQGYDRTESDAAFPCHQPCFFVATDGSTGLCPAGTREGDCIAILLGGDVPFLLRDADGEGKQFELVGECYVKGKMHEEFIQDCDEKAVEPVHFTLV